jgi:hypothetical protein
MALQFRAREFRQWSRRQFMVRAVRAMLRDGAFPAVYRAQVRESLHRLACEDDRLRRLVG